MTTAPSPAPAKFRFDLDLGHRQEKNSLLTETAMAALVNNARAEGYRDGLAEGAKSQSAKAAERLAAAAEALANHVASFSAAHDDDRQQMLGDAVGLAAAIGRKLASHLLRQQPTAEIEALIAECLASLDAVPHLVIRCAPELAEAVRDIAQTRIATSGFTGRMIVLGEPEQASGDARIEWVDGGLVRDRAVLEAEIDERITTYLAARRGPTDTGAH